MAQGAPKKFASKAASGSRRSNPGAPKKGQRAIAPKKQSLVRQGKITKKYTAGLTGKTERALAEKAGHLEMLAGGKKRGAPPADAGKGKAQATK